MLETLTRAEEAEEENIYHNPYFVGLKIFLPLPPLPPLPIKGAAFRYEVSINYNSNFQAINLK